MKRFTTALAATAMSVAALTSSATAQVDQIDALGVNALIEQDPAVSARAFEAMGVSGGTVAKLLIPEDVRPFETQIPFYGELATIRMEPYSVRAENFRMMMQLPDGSYVEMDDIPASRTMRGEIVGIAGSMVAGSITDAGFQGIIEIPSEGIRLVTEPLEGVIDGVTRTHHVMYEAADILNFSGTCGGQGMIDPELIPPAVEAGGAPRGSGDCGGICIAELACDMDIEWNNDYGGGGAAQIENIINAMNPQYENQVGITHLLTFIMVRTGPLNSDPYNSTVPGTILNEFSNHWNSTMGGVQRDVAQMYSGKSWQTSTIGLAPVGVICITSSAYNIVQNIGGFSCRTDLSAHELGHNWNSLHCSCPGNTMNPSITCANVFSNQSINSITNHRNSRGCLSAFEAGGAPLPFFDDFPSTTIDPGNWTGIDNVTINSNGINEPSGTLSLNVTGASEIRSGRMNAQFQDNLVVSYFYQRTGNGNSTESGDDLILEFFDENNQWIEVDRQLGSGPDMTIFESSSAALPNSAEHADLRIRFRNPSANAGFDDWYVDDVSVDSVAAVPGSFNLTTPADGMPGLGTGPTFIWETSENATFYTLEVDDDSDFSSPVVDGVQTPFPNFSISSGTLELGTQYFWRVTASNINGDTFGNPNPASFTTMFDLPDPFFMLGPGALVGETPPVLADLEPLLRWTESADATMYTVVIDDDQNLSSPVLTDNGPFTFNAGGAPPAFEFPVPMGVLDPGTVYFWSVTASNPGGSTVAGQGSLTFATPGMMMDVCLGDCDDNGMVDFNDLVSMLFEFGTPGSNAACDADENGTVDFNDLVSALFLFGPCP